MADESALYLTGVHGSSGLSFTLVNPFLIGLQATHGSHKLAYKRGYLVVRRVWILGHLSSPILEQALCGPTYKGSAGRSGTAGEGSPAATAYSMAISARMMAPPCGLGCGIRAETPGADPRTAPEFSLL